MDATSVYVGACNVLDVSSFAGVFEYAVYSFRLKFKKMDFTCQPGVLRTISCGVTEPPLPALGSIVHRLPFLRARTTFRTLPNFTHVCINLRVRKVDYNF